MHIHRGLEQRRIQHKNGMKVDKIQAKAFISLLEVRTVGQIQHHPLGSNGSSGGGVLNSAKQLKKVLS